jgi:hypothetical protein
LEVGRRFGGIFLSPFSESENISSKRSAWTASKACHILRLLIWRRHIPPKRRLTFNGPHGVASQKITTAVGTSNATKYYVSFFTHVYYIQSAEPAISTNSSVSYAQWRRSFTRFLFAHLGIILILALGFYSGLSRRVRTVYLFSLCVVSLLSSRSTASALVWLSNFLRYLVFHFFISLSTVFICGSSWILWLFMCSDWIGESCIESAGGFRCWKVYMGLSTALYRRSLLSVDSLDLPSSQCIRFPFRLSWFLLVLMCSVRVNLLSRCMSRYFTWLFWGRATLPICTVRQVWLRRVNIICVDLIWFILTLHFFAQSSILLLVTWSFIEAIAGSSRVAKIHQLYAKYLNILCRSLSWEMLVVKACSPDVVFNFSIWIDVLKLLWKIFQHLSAPAMHCWRC